MPDTVTEQKPPGDFVPLTTSSPAANAWAPLYSKTEKDLVFIGTFVRPPLCNSRNIAHGGVIAALADYAMGLSYAKTFRSLHGNVQNMLTSQLAIDYIGIAAMDTWLQFNPNVVHAGKSRGLTDVLVYADGNLVARSSALFRAIT